MSATVRTTTTVLPGHKIEITAPELPVGGTVEVTVTVQTPSAPDGAGILTFINSSPFRKTPEEWEQFERDFQEERNSWDR